MTRRVPWAVLLGFAVLSCAADAAVRTLASIETEPNLERRSRFALELAHSSVQPLVDAYLDETPGQAREIMATIASAVKLASSSLEETGKHARRKPKHFKYAEIQTRKLVANLKQAQRELNFDEARELDDLIADIEQENSKLLLAIMSRKTK